MTGERQAADGVQEAWLRGFGELATALAGGVPGLAPGVGEELTRYVFDGGPSDVLANVRGLASGGPLLAFVAVGELYAQDRIRALLSRVTDLPAPVAYRYLDFVDVLHTHRWWWTLPLPDGGGWLHRLVADRREADDGRRTSLAYVEEMQLSAGWEPHTLLVALARATGLEHGDDEVLRFVLRAPDLPESLTRHSAALTDALPSPVGPEGQCAARLVAAAPAAVPALAPLVAALLTSSSKRTRLEAAPLLHVKDLAGPGPLRDALLDVAASGQPAARALAYAALLQSASGLGDSAAVDRLLTQAGADRSAVVRRLAEDWTLVPADASVEPDPEPPPLDWSIPLTDEVRAVVDKLCRSAAADPPAAVATVLAVLADPSPAPSPAPGVAPPAWRERERWQVVFTDVARLGAQALAKTSAFTSGVRSDDGISGEIERVLQASPSLPDLDAAEALLAPFSVTPRAVVERYLDRWGTLGRAVPPGTAAPYLARHAAATVDVLRSEGHARHDRPRLFQALAAVPVLPDLLVRALFDIALASATTEHEPARKALAGLPGKGTRLVAALTDSRADVRRSAAAWLGELGEDAGPEAAPALLKACRKEKQDAAKAAMLGALQALGVPAEQVLDLQALEKEAAKTASAALPSPDWLRWDDAPPVRWAAAHGGRPVSPDVVRLVLAKAVRAKSAEPDALLRFWCAAWDPVDRLALGEWLLQAWVGADLTPISPTQARHMAEDDVGYHRYQINQALAAGRIHPWANLTDAEVVEALLPSTSRTPAGSAIASKGLLAVVAACGAGSPAYTAIVRRYLTDWYGLRSAQCRALLAMLAWVDHPSGTALLLEVANRFRTRGIQDEAGRLVRELAVRKGWTVDELADRTMPTAGLAEDATLVLEYGPRQFTAFLRADLTLGLRDGDGRELKALPAPRASDDAEASAAAKKAFAGAKKEVAATVKQQTSRLEEALCTGRSWAFEDWQRFLLGHPVARQSVQRLVWMQVGEPDDGEPSTVAVFRPLDDGSLTDAEDEAVVVPPQARVVLAHDAFLDPATVQAWTTHLADYGVVPPFPQLGAGFWRLPADRAGEQALTDFEGHMVEAFALRGRATKLGWTRGDSGDGGVLYDYRKRFPTAGLDAVLEFSGNQLPEENLPVAILSLAFDTIAPGGGGLRKPLGAVPPVLLSRCRADVEAIAAAGTGFDPDWEKVTNR